MEKNQDWLPDYAMFMALKDKFGGESFVHWEEKVRLRDPETLAALEEELQEEICFQKFMQYMFYVQWQNLRNYAAERGVGFIGDLPIYVAEDSADAWTHPELFKLDENGRKITVAGCPPDAFAVTGQLWGNPIYDWEHHKATGYDWWIRRLRHCGQMVDIVRIDHFRGFESFYEIPAEDDTAERGVWTKGPGMEFFRAMEEALPDMKVIAEDLGFITDDVRKLVKDSGFPNMRVMQFAFESAEPSMDNIYYPFNYDKNCVVYLGTHDNDTVVGWMEKNRDVAIPQLKKYADVDTEDIRELSWKMVVLAQSSVADLCVLQMQDYLQIGQEGRINTPSVLGGNWMWRMAPGASSPELAERIADVTKRYGR
jgi:4-alpha-glucanotransferase